MRHIEQNAYAGNYDDGFMPSARGQLTLQPESGFNLDYSLESGLVLLRAEQVGQRF